MVTCSKMWRDMHPAPTLNSAEAPEFFLNNVLFNDLKVDNSIWNTSYPFSMLSLATFGKKYTIEQDLIQFNLGGCAGIPATLASCDVQDGDSLVDLGVSDREDVWAYFYWPAYPGVVFPANLRHASPYTRQELAENILRCMEDWHQHMVLSEGCIRRCKIKPLAFDSWNLSSFVVDGLLPLDDEKKHYLVCVTWGRYNNHPHE
ncbi:unnamed protein product [Somion occarium]|uniref:Uncharacterized protein n=1 Tax=Somion occarium TaxID=3059160 RepID=A0ABP1DET1_9APHY